MTAFAKLYGDDGDQVLVMLDMTLPGVIIYTGSEDGTMSNVAFTYDDNPAGRKKAGQAFAEIDEVKAREFQEQLRGSIKGAVQAKPFTKPEKPKGL